MLAFSALAIGLLTRFAPLSTPLPRCGAPCMLYDRLRGLRGSLAAGKSSLKVL